MDPKNLALIDLGSNTVRLVIFSLPAGLAPEEQIARAEKIGEDRQFLSLFAQRVGETLTEQGFAALTHALRQQKQLAEAAGCARLFCFATASLRGLSPETLQRLERQSGVPIRLLSPEEETRCDCESLRLVLPEKPSFLGCDIGGGSGQVFALQKGRQYGTSLPIGSLRLAKEWVTGLLPTEGELARLEAYLDPLLSPLPFLSAADGCLYAMGGSARAIGPLARNLSLLPPDEEQAALSLELLDRLQTRLLAPDGEPLLMQFIPERTGTFCTGLAVLRCLMKAAGCSRLCPVKNGVREGVLRLLLQDEPVF